MRCNSQERIQTKIGLISIEVRKSKTKIEYEFRSEDERERICWGEFPKTNPKFREF